MKQNYAHKENNRNNPVIRLFLVLLLVGGVAVSGWGQLFESFETGLPTSYSDVTEFELESGTWTGSPKQVIRGTQGVNSGNYSCQLRSQTGAQITTPTLVGGVGTISFYVTASTADGGLQVRISTDDGASWTQVAGSPISFGTTTEFHLFEVNNPDVNKVQFRRTGATVYIDDVEITQTDVEFPTEGVIYISEVADAPNFNDSYLELFNNSDNPINLATSKLVMLSAGGDPETTWNLDQFSLQNIPPFGFFIITRGGDQEDFENQFGSIKPNTVFVKGSSGMYFGTGTARRWQLWEGGTEGSADGNLIDDTQSAVAGNTNRTFQNIFDGTFTTDGRDNATPGELDYLLYNGGLWVNNEELGDDTGGDDALIYDHLTISTNAAVNDLYIDANASVTINVNSEMDVNRDLISNAGEAGLLIKSDDTGTGSLIHNTDNVPATVERYFETAETWRLVSSPVVSQAVSGDWTPTGGYDDGTGYDFYAWGEATETWLNQKVPANDIDNFVPGKGYLVSFESAPHTPEFFDDLNNGDVTIAVTRAPSGDFAGANLIGNPYASGIDWNLAERELFEDNFAYVYDRTSTAEGVTEGYLPIDGTQSDAFIAPHQGFFVIKKDAGADDFTFTNAMRVHGGTFTKQQPMGEALVLRLSDETYYDQTTLRIHENSGFERDRQDARKFFSYNQQAPQIYSLTSDNVRVSINSIPHIDEEQPITLGMRIPEDGEHTLTLQDVSGAFESSTLLLEDAHKDIVHDLHAQPVYAFEAEEGDIAERFTLHFSPPDDDTTDISDTDTPEARIWHHDNTLRVDNPGEQAEIRLYDISGRLMQTIQAGTGQQSYELRLPAGAYIIQSYHKDIKPMKIIIH